MRPRNHDQAPATEAPALAPALEVVGLTVGYHGVPVVRDVEITVRSGEVVALLGANGVGKTTTLAAIAGLIRPMAGTVSFRGADITGRSAHRTARHGLALVPEDRALFGDLTVRQNLRVARRRSGSAEDEVIDLLPELGACLNRKAGVLSGGEQQMLAIGRALVGRPHVLIIDEMSLGLAPVILERLAPVLRRVADGFGTAVLVVEQHVAVALEEAERAYVMAQGRVVVAARTATLRAERDALMACYLGDPHAAAHLTAADRAADPAPHDLQAQSGAPLTRESR